MTPGSYRNITGNIALALGLVAACQLAGLPLFLGAYPITPASDILHELSKHKRFDVTHLAGRGRDRRRRRGARRLVRRRARRHHDHRARRGAQGRDHLAGRGARAAAGHRRRPAGRPVDRAADQDRAGRPAAGPVRPERRGARARSSRRAPRRTASTPRSRRPGSRSTYRTPVLLLSDGYLANGSEPWHLPDIDRPARPDPSSPSRSTADLTARTASCRTCATR